MNDEKVIRNALFTSKELHKILVKHFKNKNEEYIFKFGTLCLSTLLASFIDSIVQDDYFDKKLSLLDALNQHIRNLLVVNEKERLSLPTIQ